MALLIPLCAVTGSVRLLAWALGRRGHRWVAPWNSWPAAFGCGLAALFVSSSVTHFIEPQRSGLEAIVPEFLPAPGLVVAASGVAEAVLAVALVVPRTRRAAAIAAIVLLVMMFPANIVAAQGVDHPAAPNTPLVPRILLQLVFIAAATVAALPGRRSPHRAEGGT